MLFRDRSHGGKLLAEKLEIYKDCDAVVLAPRGGLPVGYQIADKLGLPLNILAVQRIGAPLNPEVVLGAICEDILPVLREAQLAQLNMRTDDLTSLIEIEKKEVQKQIKVFRNGRPLRNLSGKIAIVADDGLATGATLHATAKFLRSRGVDRIVVAVPISSRAAAQKIRTKVDEFHVLEECEDLLSVAHWYDDFDYVSDDEVLRLLAPPQNPSPKSVSKTLNETPASRL